MDAHLDDSGYVNRYVAYLDILGFSDLTKKADEHPSWRAYLRQSIHALKATVPPHIGHSDFRFVQFSDSIVLSALRTPQGLLTVMQGCVMLFNSMLERAILLRGGLAAGNFHHDQTVMFGPALIRAYAADKRGSPPHIAIEPEVLEDMKPSLLGPSFLDWLTQDPWDLTPMLHTLIEVEHYDGVPRAGSAILDEGSAHIAQLIQERATDMSLEPSARAKWRWLQDYWNRSVSRHGILAASHHQADWEAVKQSARSAARRRLSAHNASTSPVGETPAAGEP